MGTESIPGVERRQRRNGTVGRLLGVGVLALVALALFVGGPQVCSASGTYCETAFYSDATHSTIVGERFKSCNGSVVMYGVTSIYKVMSCEPCG
jgi:hypothetical protein